MSLPPVYLFVYGTLRSGKDFPWHELLLPASLVGPGTMRGKLYDVGNYPGAVLSDADGDQVHGEVYHLHEPPATLARLDAYEGCTPEQPPPHEYLRATAPIQMSDGTELTAQVYLYQRATETLSLVASGDYLQWRLSVPGESA